MTISLFDLFKIGLGPSSSHTTGPMLAAGRFVARLRSDGILPFVHGVRAELFGSLALTGKGHATDRALILGLAGMAPDTAEPEDAEALIAAVDHSGTLALGGQQDIAFVPAHILWHFDQRLPLHPNGMALHALAADGSTLLQRRYYSVGGGFVQDEDEAVRNDAIDEAVPYPFRSAADLLAMGRQANLAIADIARANEVARHGEAATLAHLDAIIDAMHASIDRGMSQTGMLPGGLKVMRRAAQLKCEMSARAESLCADPLVALDWVNIWAMAVNEENAAGGRIVTAPTNGAAGIIPAVLRYHRHYCNGSREARHTFLLTAAAIGALYKMNASISGAEVGCQGEVGVACSMAAAGLTAALGGTNAQIENAAEIGMEHNLGLTCDPVGGLVQIPCIERNAMGAVKAIDAAKIALMGDGSHRISLDMAIDTMKRTGADMSERYKETSRGGLAVSHPEC